MTRGDWRVDAAGATDEADVRGVLNAAMLSLDEVDVGARIEAEDVLVAVAGDTDGRRVLGACVLVPRADAVHVAAVAVRRPRRGDGIGTALVERARAREGRVTAAFDPSVRPFYESLGFAVEERSDEDGRCWGVLE